ncbi:hypothetical protein D2Q93_14555 [Alicyclobacillaceae bacterium I2511]|nr:hypothetical protein D2Q93_14555 [Alicyclobacillaceae bacterium I2511]
MAANQITRFEFICLMTYIIMTSGILALPHFIAQYTLQDGWLASGTFFAGSLGVAAEVAWFVRSFPGQTLIQGLKTAFGPWLGMGAGLWLLAWFSLFITTVFRELNVFVDTTVLPNTPLYLTDALVVLPVAAALTVGLVGIARMAEFINPLTIFSFLLVVALSLRNADFAQLRPVLAAGWSPVLRGGLLPGATFATQLVVALQLVPHLKNTRHMGRDLVYTGALLTGMGVLTEVIAISVLGPAIQYLNYPILEVVRVIRVGASIERLDTLYVMGLVAAFTVKLAVLTFAALSTLQEVFTLSKVQSLYLCAPVALWAGSVFFYRDSTLVAHYLMDVSPALFLFTLVGLPVLALVTHSLRQALRRGGPAKRPARV